MKIIYSSVKFCDYMRIPFIQSWKKGMSLNIRATGKKEAINCSYLSDDKLTSFSFLPLFGLWSTVSLFCFSSFHTQSLTKPASTDVEPHWAICQMITKMWGNNGLTYVFSSSSFRFILALVPRLHLQLVQTIT